jgi:hypothetical protein
MTAARRVAMAQREAQLAPQAQATASQAAMPQATTPRVAAVRITWGELGCPREIGLYRAAGGEIRVKRIHIIAAEDDPAALFTVVAFHPPLGPSEFVLGHRVA